MREWGRDRLASPLRAIFAAALLMIGLSAANSASAQTLSVSVNPTTYSAAGQVLHFTYTFNSGGYVVTSLSVTSAIGVSVSCPPPASNTDTNQTVVCTGNYTTKASDAVAGGVVVEVGQFNLMANTTPVSGTQLGSQTRVNYVAAALPQPNVAVTSSVNPSTVAQTVTFTAHVTAVAPATGTPTGSVAFYDSGSSIGTGTLSGGVASFTTSALSGGSHSITATYNGDSSFSSASGGLTQVVNKAASTTAVVSSLNPSLPGQTVTFTATVSGARGTPTGTVTFLDGGATIGTGTLSGGVASFSTSALSVGNHAITASYGGDTNFNVSTGGLASSQVVSKGAISAALIASQNPVGLGQSVTLTATLAAVAPATGVPTGTVTFLDGGSAIGTGVLSGGVATLTTSSLAVGDHVISISYAGDSKFNAGSGALASNPLVVSKGAATASVTSSLPSAAFGQSVTFTAHVAAVAPAAATPGGVVTFLDSGAPIGTGTLSGGAATFSTSALAPGAHTITVSYPGDGNFNAATGALGSQVVNQGGTLVTAVMTPNPATSGQAVTLSATVSANGGAIGTPTGTVTFSDGGTTLGAVALSGGAASLVVPSFNAGSHTILAAFSGDANFVASSGSVLGTVNKAGSTVTLSVNASAIFGQPVTIRASITPAAATGTVTFYDNGAAIGSSAVSGAAASVTAAGLGVGVHTITASYSGDNNNNPATAAAAQVTVGKATPAIALSASSTTPLFGTAVTFTANVSGGVSPTGSVVFKDGATVLGTAALAGGVARISTSSLSAGAHSIVATYSGDANNGAISTSTSVTVAARPDPSANADVKGLIQAQVNMAARYGQTQIGNTFRRLEQMHDEDDEDKGEQPGGILFPNGGGWSGGPTGGNFPIAGLPGAGSFGGAGGVFGSAGPGGGGIPGGGTVAGLPNGSPALAYTGVDAFSQRLMQSDASRAVQSVSGALPAAFQALDKSGVLPFHVWATGVFSFGQLRSDGTVDNHFTSSGVTVGMDGKVMDRLKAGVAIGMGFDNTSVGTQGSSSNATAYSATVYSSLKLGHGMFLDAIAGYGALRFDNHRWSQDGLIMLDGVRNGTEAYGSISLTQDLKWDALKVSPYMRLDVVRMFLDGYRETGSDIWALSYDPMNDTTLSGVLGARASYAIPMNWGVLTPGGRVEYTHAFQGGYAQNLNYADLVGVAPGYSSFGTAMAQDTISLGLSLRAVTHGATSLELEYMISTAGREFEGQQIRAAARQAF